MFAEIRGWTHELHVDYKARDWARKVQVEQAVFMKLAKGYRIYPLTTTLLILEAVGSIQ